MISKHSQLELGKLSVLKGCDSEVEELLDLYGKFDDFCVELLKEPLPLEVACSRLIACESDSEVLQLGVSILIGLKSCFGKGDVRGLQEALLKLFSKVAKKQPEWLPGLEQDVKAYVLIALAWVRGMDTKQYLISKVEQEDFQVYCRIWAMVSNPLSVGEAFNQFCQYEGALQCVAMKERSALAKEAEQLFKELTEEELREYYLKSIVKGLFTEMKPGGDFDDLVSRVKSKVECLNEQGLELFDLRLLDYALGQCKEVIDYAEND